MRVNKIAIGAVIAATLMLTGCGSSSDNTAGENESGSAGKTESSAGSTSDAGNESNSDCPELKEGVTITVAQWNECNGEAIQHTAGYAATTESPLDNRTVKANPADNELSSVGTVFSTIRVSDKTWVKTTGDWEAGDPMVAALSKSAEANAGPAALYKGATGELRVTGTGERLGMKVFIATGEFMLQGIQTKVTSELTSDYAQLAATTETTANGQSMTEKYEVTEWDKKQDIQPPK